MNRRFLACALIAGMPWTGSAIAGPEVGGCPVFPADNIWNVPIADLDVHPQSADYVASIGNDHPLQADFGSGLWQGAPMGIPYVVVPADQPSVQINFAPFADEPVPFPEESDAGPFPVPNDAPIEGGGPDAEGDRHVIVLQQERCVLYEMYKAVPNADGSWAAVSAARFDLRSNALRPDGWTSADAAGLPLLPGLVRYEEVALGEIAHALRFTAPRTARAHLWPARHYASRDTDPALPPMGLRLRLKADVDIGQYSAATQVILRALKTYGMILADNGSPWFVTGAPHPGWDDETLNAELSLLRGADFEAVDTSPLMVDPNSGATRAP